MVRILGRDRRRYVIGDGDARRSPSVVGEIANYPEFLGVGCQAAGNGLSPVMECPFCGRRSPIATLVSAIRFPLPHDPTRCYRCGGKLRAIEAAWPLPRDARPHRRAKS